MARVVVSDDDNKKREARLHLLRAHGHQAMGFEDGRAARGWMRITSADVLIVDIFNAGEDGLRTVFETRREFPSLPIIVTCTPCSNAAFYCLLAERMGADSAWPNPSADTLLQAVKSAVASHQPVSRPEPAEIDAWASAVPA